jgi:hypothetical protein
MIHEIIDAPELAKRWGVPASWVFSATRERAPRDRRIPCIRFGRYVRFEWASPALEEWLNRHRTGSVK